MNAEEESKTLGALGHAIKAIDERNLVKARGILSDLWAACFARRHRACWEERHQDGFGSCWTKEPQP